jgi:hypothetical protein
LAFSFIEESRAHIKKLPNFATEGNSVLKKHFRGAIEALFSKYNAPDKIDAVAEAQANIDGIQLVMTDNIKKMLDNTESAEAVSEKTQKMQEMSRQFQKNSSELASIMYWRNMKIKIIIGVIIIAILGYILIPIIINASK